jgi:catechol 2,3-dioxygenase-like lactoylglutathione lyase family enzyme
LKGAIPIANHSGVASPNSWQITEGAMTFHFDCVFYYVSDLDQAIHFYRDVLGLTLISRDVVARFDLDGILFEIVPSAARIGLPHAGNARLCLRVDSVEDALQELQSKGVHTGRAVKKSNGVLGSFEDPDGNEICLWQYASQGFAAEETHALFTT